MPQTAAREAVRATDREDAGPDVIPRTGDPGRYRVFLGAPGPPRFGRWLACRNSMPPFSRAVDLFEGRDVHAAAQLLPAASARWIVRNEIPAARRATP